MADLLAGVREKLAEQLAPFVDEAALKASEVSLDDLIQQAAAAVISELSHHFIVAPRKELMAVIRECDADPEAAGSVANRVILLQLALAKSRMR